MLSDVIRILNKYWFLSPLGIVACCLLVGSFSALIFGRLGSELGFVISGHPSGRARGARLSSALLGMMVGAGAGAGWGLMVQPSREAELAVLWSILGQVMGAFAGGRPLAKAKVANSPSRKRARYVIAYYTGMDLESFVTLASGMLIGMLGGIGFGIAIGLDRELNPVLGGVLGIPVGILVGSVSGYIGQNGRTLGVVLGMLLGIAVGGGLGVLVGLLERQFGGVVGSAVTCSAGAGICATIISEWIFGAPLEYSEAP